MNLIFDRGTLVLRDLPPDLDPSTLEGVRWDSRIDAHRAPARLAYPLAAELRRRGVPLADVPRPMPGPATAARPVPLRPHQASALEAWRVGGRRGVIVLPTGAGKTRVAIAALMATRTASLCLVPTRALLGQWTDALSEFHDGPIGCLGDGERRLESITVATFAAAYRHMATIGDRFGLLIVDEAHHFGTGGRDETLEMSIAPLRLGLTGTPPAPGPAATRLATLLGPVAFEMAIADLAGTLAPLQRFVWRLPLNADERREYEALGTVYRGAFRAFLGNHLNASWEDFLRAAALTDDGRRGIAAWRRARRLLAFPQAKRRALEHLLHRHRAQRTLVFVGDNETAYAVARRHLIMPLTCDIGRAERQDVLARFRAGTLRALVSAQVLNEGIDVPDAQVAIVVAGHRGEREHAQRVGRLLRPAPNKRAIVHELIVAGSAEVRQAERRWERLAVSRRSAA